MWRGRPRIVIFALCLVAVLINANEEQKVCIIGSGISASTSAYFLRQYHPTVDIEVFEREAKVGGRIAQFFIENHYGIEAGGSVIHRKNRYISLIAQELGLTLRPASEGSKRMGLHNGYEFFYKA